MQFSLSFSLYNSIYSRVLLDHFLLEAGLFESKIRIRYACVHLVRFTKEIEHHSNNRSNQETNNRSLCINMHEARSAAENPSP
jgi:hypothetical protein